jgi:hypothetical protein
LSCYRVILVLVRTYQLLRPIDLGAVPEAILNKKAKLQTQLNYVYCCIEKYNSFCSFTGPQAFSVSLLDRAFARKRLTYSTIVTTKT